MRVPSTSDRRMYVIGTVYYVLSNRLITFFTVRMYFACVNESEEYASFPLQENEDYCKRYVLITNKLGKLNT